MAYLLSLAALPANVAILVDHEKEVLGLKEDTHEGIKKPSGRLLQGLQDIKKHGAHLLEVEVDRMKTHKVTDKPKSDKREYQFTTLKNGLNVILIEDEKSPQAAFSRSGGRGRSSFSCVVCVVVFVSLSSSSLPPSCRRRHARPHTRSQKLL